MHKNIAQITRTWVAIQLATGLTTHRGMEVVFATHTTNNTGGFHRAISNPTETIKWNNQTESFTGSGQLPTQHSTDSLTTQTPVIDDTCIHRAYNRPNSQKEINSTKYHILDSTL